MATRSGLKRKGKQKRLKRAKAKVDEQKLMKFEPETDMIESIPEEGDTVHQGALHKNVQVIKEITEEKDHNCTQFCVSFTECLDSGLELPEKTNIPIKVTSEIIKRMQSVPQEWDELEDSHVEYQVSEAGQDTANTEQKENCDTDAVLMQQIAKMSTEELGERVFECIRLCVENKINLKNAFSLHLVDWLLHLLKHKNTFVNNFSTLACTLDASTKIYSYRVDIVYKEVLRLANLITPSVKNKKGILQSEEGTREKVKTGQLANRMKKKKTIIVNPATLQRKCASKNPLRKFVKVGAQPGDLMEAMLKTGKTFLSEAPFRPVCKVPYMQGKLVPLRIRIQRNCLSGDQKFCSLSRICYQLLGRNTRKEEKVVAIKGTTSCNKYGEDSDIDTAYDGSDPSFNALLSDFDGSTEPKEIVDRMAQKVKESVLVDAPRPFNKLSRLEKLSLFLLPNDNLFINPDLEDLLYGPLRARRVRKNPGKILRRKRPVKTRKTKAIQFLDFEADPDNNPVETSNQKKSKGKSRKPRIKRTTLMPKTVNNWNEVKVMGPEEMVISKNFLHVLSIKEDITMEDENDEVKEETSESELMNRNVETCYEWCYHENEAENPSTWMNQVENSTDTELMQKKTVTEGKDEEDAVSVNNFSGICSRIEEPVIAKFQKLNCPTLNRLVNMKHLKGVIKSVLSGITNDNKENAPDCTENAIEVREQESESEFQPIMFSDLYSQVLSKLDDCSPNDLTPQMAFVALLHVVSENELLLVNGNNDTSDPLIIKKVKNSDSSRDCCSQTSAWILDT